MVLKIKKLVPHAIIPTRAYQTDMGIDLYCAESVVIHSNREYLEKPGTTLISTGIAMQFPVGYGALIRDRSGIATKSGLFVVAGVIDETYTGEIKIAIRNSSAIMNHINRGDKIAQLILLPTPQFIIEEVEELYETDRGSKGFGSSGS